MKRSSPLFLACLIAATLTACTNFDLGQGKDVNPESVFFDYRVWAEEGSEIVTCMFQYKIGGADGTSIVLEGPSKVELDGKILTVDSAKFTGSYYEIEKTVHEFTGKHTIVFTGSDQKQYKEEFDFTPFSLLIELPQRIKREPFMIKLKNFPARETPLRLVMTDTDFSSNDINEIIPVVKGEVHIDNFMLNQIMNGPITLELYREEERSVRQKTKEGGRISITYGLKREFELTD